MTCQEYCEMPDHVILLILISDGFVDFLQGEFLELHAGIIGGGGKTI